MNEPTDGGHGRRRDRMLRERQHNTYKPAGKLSEPSMCADCNANYHAGRWQWGGSPVNAASVRCEACQRIADDYPAGILQLSGSFTAANGEEIVNLARNEEAAENGEHPLHRIMDIATNGDGVTIRTTDIHLPKRIGDALYRAYSGRLDIQYEPGGNFVRAAWQRDE